MLIKRQEEILDIIISYIEEEGISPTVRELVELSNLSSTATVHGYLKRLEKNGYIVKRAESPRYLRVIKGQNKESLFGHRIRGLREKAGMTKAELAKIIGVSVKALGDYKVNERVHPKEEILVKLAETFNLYMEELLKGYDVKQLDKYGDVRNKEALHGIKILDSVFTGG